MRTAVVKIAGTVRLAPPYRVVTEAEATAALETLCQVRPGASRWVVTGLASGLVGTYADRPSDSADVDRWSPPMLPTRDGERDDLIDRCQPEAARIERRLPSPPKWLTDEDERAAWVAHKRLSVQPRQVVDVPEFAATIAQDMGGGVTRLLAPSGVADPFEAEPRLRALTELVRWLSDGDAEVPLGAVGALVHCWVGPGRWATGGWLLRHMTSPRRQPCENPQYAGTLAAADPEAVTAELLRRAAPHVLQIPRPA